MISSPVVKILALQASGTFYAISGSKIFLIREDAAMTLCISHPEGKKWSSVAALSTDEKCFAVSDCEKNLHIYEIQDDSAIFNLFSVPMHLAKTATSVKFTDYPAKWTVLVADKFGDALRFQVGDEFDKWARESRKNSKTLSIHSKAHGNGNKRTATEAETVEAEVEEQEAEDINDSSEAHHCTIIGHISMVTDLQVLPIKTADNIFSSAGLIVTCDRDEKVRVTRAHRPELIHSFGLGHREFVGTLAVCEATRCIYSAGGDKFIAEWAVEGEECETLRLKSKIGVDGGIVQEVKINTEGTELYAHIDKFGLLCFNKQTEDGEWVLKETVQDYEMTCFDLTRDSFVSGSWSSATGTSFKNAKYATDSGFDQISAEEGQEIVDLLSKSKLRKDIERMDWKQKKHANQKPRD